MIKLYSYWRSTASYRVRIALNLKQVPHEIVSVNLLEGAQQSAEFLNRNPQGLIPVMEQEDGVQLTQSMAMLEYLEESYPKPALLPQDSLKRAQVRAMANMIACDIHPIGNLRVQKYVCNRYAQDAAEGQAWAAHWIELGFTALEATAARNVEPFLSGADPGLADCVLIPQIYNAQRFGLEMQRFAKLWAIAGRCADIKAFEDAQPENQPDAT